MWNVIHNPGNEKTNNDMEICISTYIIYTKHTKLGSDSQY